MQCSTQCSDNFTTYYQQSIMMLSKTNLLNGNNLTDNYTHTRKTGIISIWAT